MRYVPVVVEGAIAGYLYATDWSEWLQFMGTTGRLDYGFVSDAEEHWRRRAAAYRRQGLNALRAMEAARHEPADEYGGKIPGDAEVAEVEDWNGLRAIAKPDFDPANPYKDASMVGWGPGDREEPELVSYQVWQSYGVLADGPCVYRPVRMGDKMIGYLWASPAENAAGFEPNLRVRPESDYAEGWWLREFTKQHMRGLNALEAIRARIGEAEHPRGGRVDGGDEERDVESLDALQRLAGNDRAE